MLIPNLYTVPNVMAASGYTEEQALQWGYSGDIVFMVLVPEIGACRVPELALSHFMAGVDDYIADGMPEHYSGSLSGPWTIKRDRLRILADSWEAFSKPWRQQAAIILAADARAIAEKAAKEGKVTLDVLASEISQKLVVRDRGNEFADDSMGLTVAATRYKIGAPEQGLPGVRLLMLKMVEGEEIKALAVTNNMPPVRVTDVSADNFAQWHLSQEDAAKVMAELLNKPQAAPVVAESVLGGLDAVVHSVNTRNPNKKPKTIEFEKAAMAGMTAVWNDYKLNKARDTTLKVPTKGEMHEQVMNQLIADGIKSANSSPTMGMVFDATKKWKKPALMPVSVSPSVAPQKRHAFKGER